jgi:ribonuclease E
MLIDAQRPEELRVAIVNGNTLESFQVDVAESGLTRGNIYRGTIANVQPSLNAAFIDYGVERHGFLSIQDVVPQAYYREPAGPHPRIEEVLDRGKPIVVQVQKDAVGQKGAALTTNLSLAGRYLVLTPFDEVRGVSRKVEDEDTRKKLKVQAARLELPPGCGVIVRTNALDQTKATLARDLAALLRLWKRVQAEATVGGRGGARLLYTDQDLIVQALRDHLDASIEEVLVDDDEAFARAESYMQAFMPRGKTRLVRYAERLPLFSRYELEAQIDRIHQRAVPLPSGGSIVIDGTEALTAIDVNSGRSTRAATQEETAVHTNLEAAVEVARQLRLRDIGGLVVVDFIDMRASRNQRKVEKALRDAMKEDKARASVGRISPNGLLEINRQRIRQALQIRTRRPCPTCGGAGSIASPEAVSLNLLRRIEARAASGLVEAVRIGLHPELADALQNGRRQELAALEREFDIRIEVNASPALHRAEEKVDWAYREKPAAPPRRQAPARPAISVSDLLPAAGDEEPEEEEPAYTGPPEGTQRERPPGRQRPPRPARQGRGQRPERAAAPQAPPAPEAGREEGGKRGKKRRRGGRTPKPGAPPGPAAEGASPEARRDGAQHPGDESPSYERAELAEPGMLPEEAEPGEAPLEAGEPREEGGGAPRKKRRGRRRRGKRSGSAETAGEAAGEGHDEPRDDRSPVAFGDEHDDGLAAGGGAAHRETGPPPAAPLFREEPRVWTGIAPARAGSPEPGSAPPARAAEEPQPSEPSEPAYEPPEEDFE